MIKKLVGTNQLFWMCLMEALIDVIMNGVVNLKIHVPEQLFKAIEYSAKSGKHEERVVAELLNGYYSEVHPGEHEELHEYGNTVQFFRIA